MAANRDDILARIEAFNEVNGGGVVIQKAAKGYSLFRADTGQPIARLRPTGKDDQVEAAASFVARTGFAHAVF